MTGMVLALYTEGPTDGNTDKDFNFLPQVIQRTAENILLQHGWSSSEIDVQLPYVRCKKETGEVRLAQSILSVARDTNGYHALIIHSDGDDRGYEKTLVERFHPGKDLVLAAKNMCEAVCVDLVPIIPVRMTEAWMLADPDALCTVLGTKIEAAMLGTPAQAKLVEKELDPKARLKFVIKAAYPGLSDTGEKRFRQALFRELGKQISLKRLHEVPSYQFFVRELTATLLTLNFIQNK
jgi:hypothetical protein